MSEETNKNNAHDEHHDHSFPNWVTFGHTDDPVDGFIKIFAWLNFIIDLTSEKEKFGVNKYIKIKLKNYSQLELLASSSSRHATQYTVNGMTLSLSSLIKSLHIKHCP